MWLYLVFAPLTQSQLLWSSRQGLTLGRNGENAAGTRLSHAVAALSAAQEGRIQCAYP